MPYTVYIVVCADKTLYTGYAKQLDKRIESHNTSPAGAKYTRARRPVRLVYSEKRATLSAALKREAAIKRLTRAQKLALIKTRPTTVIPSEASRRSRGIPPAH